MVPVSRVVNDLSRLYTGQSFSGTFCSHFGYNCALPVQLMLNEMIYFNTCTVIPTC